MSHPTTVFYHADCLDGFGAAYAAWRYFQGDATYRPLHHGQDWREENLDGRDVFILDFSFPPAELLAMARIARSVLVLDHHITARNAWAGHLVEDGGNGLASHKHPEQPLTVAFDMGKSGVRLAWEHFHPGTRIPLALAHIEDQDLWRYSLADTRPFCRALRLRAFDFGSWDEVVKEAATPESSLYLQMVAAGTAIERFCAVEVERLGNGALVMPATLRGEPVDPLQTVRHGLPTIDDGSGSWRAVTGLAINASALFASDLGNHLAQRSGSFGLVWQLAGDGDVKVSLRARGRVNVALVAENYGGGGHANAAGFRMPARRFMEEVLKPAPLPTNN